jgi:hypothetical protein
MEAKFNNSPNDYDVAKSPLVNKMYSEVLDTLLQAEFKKSGEAGRKRWLEWLNLNQSRREWTIIQKTICREKKWQSWDSNQQREFVKEVAFPFTLSDELLDELSNQRGHP